MIARHAASVCPGLNHGASKLLPSMAHTQRLTPWRLGSGEEPPLPYISITSTQTRLGNVSSVPQQALISYRKQHLSARIMKRWIYRADVLAREALTTRSDKQWITTAHGSMKNKEAAKMRCFRTLEEP